ncbi:MAG: hypothetical protein A3D47_00355, partial [Candidatus Colwellbacteria bacterium RIFCSPHIGHO2_02_FULL_43_15]
MEPTTDIKKIIGISVLMIVVIGGIYWFTNNKLPSTNQNNQPADTNQTETNMEIPKEIIKATINTDKGAIVLNLYPNAAPKTVENFVTKAKAKYFDGLKFHRVEDWVIQGGDPLSRDASKEAQWGTGGGNIDTELSPFPFIEGALGVARGQDIKVSNDSQFFIVTKDSNFLDNQYTLFGQVVEGMDVVKKVAK